VVSALRKRGAVLSAHILVDLAGLQSSLVARSDWRWKTPAAKK
jgi:hypothetical protein